METSYAGKKLRLYVIVTILSILILSLNKISSSPFRRIDLSGLAQGTTWHITYYAPDSLVTKKQVDSILLVLDSSMSIYKPYSRIVAFNNSKKGIPIDEHFKKVVAQSLETYRQTNGLFDITVFPLVEAWGFASKPLLETPDSATILSIMSCVSSRYLQLRAHALLKTKPCVKIDVNGVAQGYSVDVVARFFENKGITNYIVEIGGEIRVLGKKQPGNESFKIGIEAPSDEDVSFSPLEKIIIVDSGAITTSGNYRRYHESSGKKFSHLMDPRTGYSIQNEMISVTVYAKDAITADAYDNALMLMGIDKALQFVEKRTDMAAFFIYKRKDGSIADTASKRFSFIEH